MLAFLYLCISIIFGISLVKLFVNTEELYSSISDKEFSKNIFKALFIIPAGIIVGIMVTTFVNYYIIYILNMIIGNSSSSYIIGITLVMIITLGLSILNFMKFNRKKHKKNTYLKKDKIYFCLIIIGLMAAVSFLMFYTCRIENDKLLLGYSTFSDLAPHTAMVSSFGVGGNIPTSYMHFSGDGIKWHFFFYFFSGILNYLGFPIDFALNIPSILTMVAALTLIGLLATLLCKNKLAFLFAPILVLFRSALNIFYVVKNLINTNRDVISTLINNKTWSDITPFDNWGLWTINVYPNQRHLMLGVAVILILIMVFIPFVKDMMNSLKKYKWKEKIKYLFLSKDAWVIKLKDKSMVLAIILVICLPYFHGSALITSLLVLFGLAIFSKNRLMYLGIAIISIISSVIQTNLFSGGANNVIGLKLNFGFVASDISFEGIINYVLIITGCALIVALIYIIMKRKDKLYPILFCSFLLPFVFAFIFQVTVEMAANHKFIQFSIILIDLFVAGFLAELFAKVNNKKGNNIFNKITNNSFIRVTSATVLLICLTATGISEWIIYINLNKNNIEIDTKSELTAWVKENTEKTDVFLTPMWATNRFFLAGRASFYGWPYYAYSAGHDTYGRDDEYFYLLTGANKNRDEFIESCKKHGIKYVVDDNEFFNYINEYPRGVVYDRKFIRDNFKAVAVFEEESTRIYKIY